MQDIIINADDYAMDGGVDAGILGLAARGVISATSAMVLSPRWAEASRALRDAPLSRGLHLDFTSPFTDAVFPRYRLSALILSSHARHLNRAQIRTAIDNQLELFESGLGCAPDFIDGHQHVHHLPIVREEVFEALTEHYGSEKARVGLRICAPRHWRGVKAAIVAGTGAFGLARIAAALGHPMNTDFAGVYDFARHADLAGHWRGWMSRLEGALPLVMCHVALRSDDDWEGDPIRQARYREYDWLASEEFRSLRRHFSVDPVRWPQA
jgi:predicted glycoside hydrolase/deacetylase ChbG (UPF0249 family)